MIQILIKKYNSLFLKYFQLRKNMNHKNKELDKTKDELDKYVHRKKPSKIKTSKAKSFEDQKRKRKR